MMVIVSDTEKRPPRPPRRPYRRPEVLWREPYLTHAISFSCAKQMANGNCSSGPYSN
jgi:hypothetical protein